jgi:chitin disaccharide deacetylase
MTAQPGAGVCVTADDWGRSPPYDRAIEELADSGAVQAVSVMAHADADLGGAARLRKLGVVTGLHLVLTDGRALTGAPPLVGRDGRFPPGYRALFARTTRRALLRRCLEEGLAQASRLRAAGFRIAFLNAHEHVHLFPLLWPVFARLAEDLRIGAVRVALGQPIDATLQGALALASRIAWTRRPLAGRTVLSPLGVGSAGALTAARVDALLRRPFDATRGMRELCVHPHPAEQAWLRSRELGELLAAHGLRRVSPRG